MSEKRVSILCLSVHDVGKAPNDEAALIAELVWGSSDEPPSIRLSHPGAMSDVEVGIDMVDQLRCAMKILVDEADARTADIRTAVNGGTA